MIGRMGRMLCSGQNEIGIYFGQAGWKYEVFDKRTLRAPADG